MTVEHCPTCGRELSDIKRFPRIEVRSVELMPLPEKILHWSSERAGGIKGELDITAEIQEALKSQAVQQYLDGLCRKASMIVALQEILPPFKQNEYFSVFVIPDSEYFLDLRNEDGQDNIAVLTLYGHGPNLGSAGGPALEQYATLAKLSFKGHLLS